MSAERGSILIEVMPVTDKALEVIAIDEKTGREVRFPVPIGTREPDIKQLAAQKMDYVLRKDAERAAEKKSTDEKDKPPRKDPRGGIIV
ncbi:DUF6898 family protein [Ponticaulis profundi]|uniref:DUF6898 family protein n=1 Tax=Ponticaulis profundi TaxID=2665222 RepID=A0ABW1S754_9PROT